MNEFVYDGSNGATASKVLEQLRKFFGTTENSIMSEKKFENEDHQQNHQHGHSLAEVHSVIDGCIFSDGTELSAQAKNDAKGIFEILTECECVFHQKKRETIHFHEIGRKENILKICQICDLIEKNKIEKFSYTPLNLGHGKIVCSHGELEIPAPATRLIINGMDTYTDKKDGELTTPSGAAIIKYFSSKNFSEKSWI